MVRRYEGDSLSSGRSALGVLVARGVDDPEAVVGIKTNCATFALGVLWAVGVRHPLLRKPYVDGMAFAWLDQIGRDFNAWRGLDEAPIKGAILWYRTEGRNDDHAEFFLSPPDEHGGGGRVDNAIAIIRSDISTSSGRPLYQWLDPQALPAPLPPSFGAQAALGLVGGTAVALAGIPLLP